MLRTLVLAAMVGGSLTCAPGLAASAATPRGLAPAAPSAVAAEATTPATAGAACEWPMYGNDAQRDFASTCASAPTEATVATLRPRWFFHAGDVVTATPSVAGGVAYVGDWHGDVYALRVATSRAAGEVLWSTVIGGNRPAALGNVDHHSVAYGQVTSSAAVATVAGRRLVILGGGGSVYALDAGSGAVVWRFDTEPAVPTAHAEVESSPVVWRTRPEARW